jgi:hypothetical protein
MPNHCSNSLTVTGPGAEDFMSKIKQAHAEKDSDDNYNLLADFIPMPAVLTSMHRGSCTIDGVLVNLWRSEDGVAIAVSDEEREQIRAEHGTDDWYTWAIKHWGTKWGTYESQIASDNRVTFTSAWSPPTEGVMALSRQFPETTFTLAYAESGMDYFGVTEIRDGHLLADTEMRGCYVADVDWDSEEAEDDPDYGQTTVFADHLDKYTLHPGG